MSDTKVTAPSNSTTLDVDACVALYVELRDAKAAMKAKLKKDLEPYNQGMKDLDALLLKHLQDQKAENLRTASGTVYQRVERSATIRDKKAFSEFVIQTSEFDLIDWRANKVSVFDYIEANKTDVPGLNTSSYMTIGVRRGDAPQEDNDNE